MIRTKQPQRINDQLRISKIIYFRITERFEGKQRAKDGKDVECVAFKMQQYTIENGKEIIIGESPVLFKKTRFYAMFGEMSFNAFNTALPALMIQQIDWVNKYEYTGDEIQQVTYWELTADDLEIVPTT